MLLIIAGSKDNTNPEKAGLVNPGIPLTQPHNNGRVIDIGFGDHNDNVMSREHKTTF